MNLRPAAVPFRRAMTVGGIALAIGLILLVTSMGILGFLNRFNSRVDVDGLVQQGVAYDQIDNPDATLDNMSGYGVYKVDYKIDGVDHVGFILGNFATGRTIQVSAPNDGSPYVNLRLADSTARKISSWATFLPGVALTGFGLWWASSGLIRRGRDIRERTSARYGVPLRQPRVVRVVPPPPPPTPEPPVDNPFTRPYDI